jgi:hypothetical protein
MIKQIQFGMSNYFVYHRIRLEYGICRSRRNRRNRRNYLHGSGKIEIFKEKIVLV